jgi:L-arabinonolactonase
MIEVAFRKSLELGESILWDDRRQSLAWVDIHKGHLWQMTPGDAPDLQTLPDRVGAIGLREAGGFVVGLAKGFGIWDGAYRPLHGVDGGQPHLRLNDGRCDRFGNFLCGGMDESGGRTARLYRLRPSGQMDVLLDGIGCANATCFSPDGLTLYFSDMGTRQVLAYDYHPEKPLGPSRLMVDLTGRLGLPDGATVDAEGCLWLTHWGGLAVTRHAPDGRQIAEIPLPVTNPTCPCLGGADLRTLYLTTARFQLDADVLSREHLAGSILAIPVDVPGLPEARFAG